MRRTIRQLADEIRREWPDLDVQVERGYASTDRDILARASSHGRVKHLAVGPRGKLQDLIRARKFKNQGADR